MYPRFGINTFLFASPFTLRNSAFFTIFKSWGFDSVELALEDPADTDPSALRAALDEAGLACHSVCAAMSPDRDLRGTPSQQQTARRYLEALLDLMPTLGAGVLCGPLYSAVGRTEAVSSEEQETQLDTVTAHLRALGERAEAQGLVLAVEPLNRFETDFLNTVEQGLRLVERVNCPGVGLHLDTFHMNIEEKSQAAAIRRAGSALRHLHASGSDRGTPGNDHLDWPGIAAALRDIGYEGDVVIESFTPEVKSIARAAAIWRAIEPSPERIARDGLRFLTQLFA